MSKYIWRRNTAGVVESNVQLMEEGLSVENYANRYVGPGESLIASAGGFAVYKDGRKVADIVVSAQKP